MLPSSKMETGEWNVSEGEPLSPTSPGFKPLDGVVIKTQPANHISWTPEADHVSWTPGADHVSRTPEADHVSWTAEADCVSRTPEADRVSRTPEADHVSWTAEADRVSRTPEADHVSWTPEADRVSRTAEADHGSWTAEADHVSRTPEADQVSWTPQADHISWTPGADHVSWTPDRGHSEEGACSHGLSREECRMRVPREGWDSVCDEDMRQEEAELGQGPIVMRGEDFWVEIDPAYESDNETSMDLETEFESESNGIDLAYESDDKISMTSETRFESESYGIDPAYESYDKTLMTLETKFESESDSIETAMDDDSTAMRMAYSSDGLGWSKPEPERTFQVKTEIKKESGEILTCAEPEETFQVRTEPKKQSGGIETCAKPRAVDAGESLVRMGLSSIFSRPCRPIIISARDARARKRLNNMRSILPADLKLKQNASTRKRGVPTAPPALKKLVPVMDGSGNVRLVAIHAPAAPPAGHRAQQNASASNGGISTEPPALRKFVQVKDILGNVLRTVAYHTPTVHPSIVLSAAPVVPPSPPSVQSNSASSRGIAVAARPGTGGQVVHSSRGIPGFTHHVGLTPCVPSVPPALSRDQRGSVGVGAGANVATSVPATNVALTIIRAAPPSASLCSSVRPQAQTSLLPVSMNTGIICSLAHPQAQTSLLPTSMNTSIVCSSVRPQAQTLLLPMSMNTSSWVGVAGDTRSATSVTMTNAGWTVIPAAPAVVPSTGPSIGPSIHPSIHPLTPSVLPVQNRSSTGGPGAKVDASVPVTAVSWTLVPAASAVVPSASSCRSVLVAPGTAGHVGAAADTRAGTSVPLTNVVWTLVPASACNVPSVHPSVHPSVASSPLPPGLLSLPSNLATSGGVAAADPSVRTSIPVTSVPWTSVAQAGTPSVSSTPPGVIPPLTIFPVTTPSVPSILPLCYPPVHPPAPSPAVSVFKSTGMGAGVAADTRARTSIPVTNVSWAIVQAGPSSVPSSFPPAPPLPGNAANGGCAVPLVVHPPIGLESLRGTNVLPGSSGSGCVEQVSRESQANGACTILPKNGAAPPMTPVLVRPVASPVPVVVCQPPRQGSLQGTNVSPGISRPGCVERASPKPQATAPRTILPKAEVTPPNIQVLVHAVASPAQVREDSVYWVYEEKLNNDSQLLKTSGLESRQACSKQPGPGKYPCPACPKQYRRASHLAVHMCEEHRELQHYICLPCSKRFEDRASLTFHVVMMHRATREDLREYRVKYREKSEVDADSADTREYVCEQCQETFAGKPELKDHENSVHKDPGKFACKYCSKIFDGVPRLKIHVAMVHKDLVRKEKSQDCDKL